MEYGSVFPYFRINVKKWTPTDTICKYTPCQTQRLQEYEPCRGGNQTSMTDSGVMDPSQNLHNFHIGTENGK